MPDPMTCGTDELAEMVTDSGQSPKDLWPPALAELVDVLASYFERHHSKSGARFWAESVVIEIAEHFGGRATYLPRGDSLRRALRNLRICRQFDGKNVDALAGQFRMSAMQIRSILKRGACQMAKDRK